VEHLRRVLVTGGAGFLGSHLCDRLIADGATVTCLDSLYTGSRSNIAHLLSHERFAFRHANVMDAIEGEYDEIYNLACPASPPRYQADPIYTLKTSVFGALNVLELARKNGAKVFQASTSEVYGDPQVHPQCESYWGHVNPIGIRSCYDEGKRVAETLFFDYQRRFGTRIKVVRIFNTYGPRMDPEDGRVVSNFIVQSLRGESLTIYGDGSQTRSFCYVDDLIEGFVRMMASNNDVTGPINMGNPSEFTIRQLAYKLTVSPNVMAAFVHKPLPSDDPLQRRPDITLAKQLLGWEPKVTLDEGLRKTIPYFAERIGVAAPPNR
jgi:UDP-glucuronate decarboxylase